MADKIIRRCFDNTNREAYVTYRRSNGTTYIKKFKIIHGIYKYVGLHKN